MNKHTSYLIAAFLALGIPAFAHSGAGHDHGRDPGKAAPPPAPPAKLDDAGVIQSATKVVSAMVDTRIPVDGVALGAEWKSIPDADKTIGKTGKGYRVVAFKNIRSGKTLHLLMSDTGSLYDANHTGVFKDLKD